MKSGVYKIENQITKDIYIGSSVHLANRKSRHFVCGLAMLPNRKRELKK